jgi:hypothetical protein
VNIFLKKHNAGTGCGRACSHPSTGEAEAGGWRLQGQPVIQSGFEDTLVTLTNRFICIIFLYFINSHEKPR